MYKQNFLKAGTVTVSKLM